MRPRPIFLGDFRFFKALRRLFLRSTSSSMSTWSYIDQSMQHDPFIGEIYSDIRLGCKRLMTGWYLRRQQELSMAQTCQPSLDYSQAARNMSTRRAGFSLPTHWTQTIRDCPNGLPTIKVARILSSINTALQASFRTTFAMKQSSSSSITSIPWRISLSNLHRVPLSSSCLWCLSSTSCGQYMGPQRDPTPPMFHSLSCMSIHCKTQNSVRLLYHPWDFYCGSSFVFFRELNHVEPLTKNSGTAAHVGLLSTTIPLMAVIMFLNQI